MNKLKESFLNPDSEFTPVPFWFWNDALDKEELKRQITDFYNKGIMGFVIHPRMGLPKEIEYLSDKYMDYVKCAVELAASLHMFVVLYDEGMYPSGSAHGMVVKGNPEYASRGLKMVEYSCGIGPEITVELDDGDRIVSVQAIKKINNIPVQTSIKKLEYTDGKIFFRKPGHEDWSVLVFIETYSKGTIRGIHLGEDDGEPDAPASADLLNEKAMKKFITLTHERYYSVLKEYFGKTITAIFTDEPVILGRCPIKGLIPWTQGFLDYFISNGGKESDLPALFYDMGSSSDSAGRIYKKAVTGKLEESYYIPLSKWCEGHGIQLTGHPEKSGDIGLLKHFHIPGQDIVWRWVAPEDGKALHGEHSTAGKCSSDSARHYGKRRNSNECFGCCGPDNIHWSFSADDMKWYLDWLFVRGVNMIFPHAFYYSVRGKERYGERPPDVGPNNIWWKYYGSISSYIKRLCWLMTDSVNQTKVAVLCREDHLPWKIVKLLYENQIEFNYLEYDLLTAGNCKIIDGSINIEKQKYNILLIEDEKLYTGMVGDRIDSFIESGGKVIIYSPNSSITKESVEIITDYYQVLDKLEPTLVKTLSIEPANKDLRVSHVVKEGSHFYLLVNEGDKAIEGEICIKNFGQLEKWDAWKGTMEELPAKLCDNDGIAAEIKLERRESMIIRVNPQKTPLLQTPKVEAGKTIILKDSIDTWSVERPGCKPYYTDKLESWHQWENFNGYSGTVTYKACFEIDDLCNNKKMELDLGKVHEIAHVYVNGRDMGFKLWKPYVFDISGAMIRGENQIIVEVTNSKANYYEDKRFESGLIGPVQIRCL